MAQTNILLESGTNEFEIVEFYLDEAPKFGGRDSYRGYYGINVAKVLEIIRMPELTDMPEVSHPSVLGAFNLRQKIIPLIDLAVWLGKKKAEREPPKVIVTEFNQVTTAFLVSGVTRIHRLSWERVEAPNLYVATLTSNSITGVIKLEGRIVFILDMEKIVANLNPGMVREAKVEPETKEAVENLSLRAMVVDDSTMARRMVASLLEQAGFKVTRTINGKMAWDQLTEWSTAAKEESRPITDYVSIVVSDIEMPAMDGHHLTRRIKSDPFLRQLPVMLCSSIITETLRHKGTAVGADDQISKAEMAQHLANRALDLVRKAQAENRQGPVS